MNELKRPFIGGISQVEDQPSLILFSPSWPLLKAGMACARSNSTGELQPQLDLDWLSESFHFDRNINSLASKHRDIHDCQP
jgi:hypothetical protein